MWSRIDVRHAHLADDRAGRACAQPGARRGCSAASPASTAGSVDTVIQRVIEILRSIPTIPLWMGLAAAMPQDWTILQVYFTITIIISLIGWTELARVVRGRFLSLREEDFVMAAELVGASQRRIIFVHMVPLFLSHIIAADDAGAAGDDHQRDGAQLPRPRPAPAGDQLGRAAAGGPERPDRRDLAVAAAAGRAVILVILAFNFLGDGLRDAADPYRS